MQLGVEGGMKWLKREPLKRRLNSVDLQPMVEKSWGGEGGGVVRQRMAV
jgi:hypothetical protein